MTQYKEILRLYMRLGINKSQIAKSLGCSRTTVIATLAAAEQSGLEWKDVEGLSDREIKDLLYPSSDSAHPQYKMPDWDYIHKEMSRMGVTLSLLWVEYCETCRNSGQIPYQSTQFYKYYREYAQKHHATMHIERKPGDIMEVDWAGDPAQIVDPLTGEAIKAYIFVAALAYSRYAYVEAFLTQKETAWIAGHNSAYRFFGGVTRIVVPDNLKTGVTLNSKDETVINRTYQEMAEHYDTAVLPARPLRPRDKPTAEGEVRVVSTWIVAALRNQTFFSLAELNAAIMQKLRGYNERPFQKKEGSRLSMFHDEKAFMRPLPKHPFEIALWKKAKLQDNYHVCTGGKYYSAPYEYIGKELDVRVSEGMIEIFFSGTRIASHPLLRPNERKYSTREEHMPPEHRRFGEWDADRFRSWADKFGTYTRTVTDYFFSSVKVEQQAYKTCRALLHLADRYSAARLEAACGKAISYSPYPSLRSVKAILQSGRDRLPDTEEEEPSPSDAQPQGFLRGAACYKTGGEE